MKKKIIAFLGCSALLLAIVPSVNLLAPPKLQPNQAWWHRAVLFNLDFALPYVNQSLYALGFSVAPKETVLGEHGWLFLGEEYQQDININRRGVHAEELAVLKKIGSSTNAWQAWLAQQGVKSFKMMLCPNKATVYAEFLPNWAKPVTTPITDTLLAQVNPDLYVDTRATVLAAKARYPQPLFFKTDTHWNTLGAWFAFQTFTQEIKRSQPSLQLLDEASMSVSPPAKIDGGDLAHFLRMQTMLADTIVYAQHKGTLLQTEQVDFLSGKLQATNIGNPEVAPPITPLLIKSPQALNKMKVLWLRDSFGVAVSPFMAATFSETLQLHYNRADPALLAQLVKSFKPDYVFVTVVERESRHAWFSSVPPASGVQ